MAGQALQIARSVRYSTLLLVAGALMLTVAAGVAIAGGAHTCSACHPSVVTLCDTDDCAGNEACGIDYGGDGTGAWVKVLCVVRPDDVAG